MDVHKGGVWTMWTGEEGVKNLIFCGHHKWMAPNDIHHLTMMSLTARHHQIDRADDVDIDIFQPPEVVRLMSCLGYIISTLPFHETLTFLSETLSPHLDELRNLAAAGDVSRQTIWQSINQSINQ